MTWSPFKSNRTTFRAGAGIFYDWYETSLYEQTLRLDGTRQTDVIIRNPGYPDPLRRRRAAGDAAAERHARLVRAGDADGEARVVRHRARGDRLDAAARQLLLPEHLGRLSRGQRQRAGRWRAAGSVARQRHVHRRDWPRGAAGRRLLGQLELRAEAHLRHDQLPSRPER